MDSPVEGRRKYIKTETCMGVRPSILWRGTQMVKIKSLFERNTERLEADYLEGIIT